VTPTAGELEVRVCPWQGEEDPVVPFVVCKAADLWESEAVAVEADDLDQPFECRANRTCIAADPSLTAVPAREVEAFEYAKGRRRQEQGSGRAVADYECHARNCLISKTLLSGSRK